MNSIVTLAANALPGEKKFILFVGAGVSKDAEVPTSWDLMLETASLLYVADGGENTDIDLEKWFTKSEYSKLTYSELIEKLYPNYSAQQDFLKKYLNNYKIGDVHRSIAELARRGIIRCIITTNFDNYIEKAIEEIGLEPQVISTEEDVKNSEPLIHCKSVRIYKPNGTLGKGKLRNTPKDLKELEPCMKEELIRILDEHGVMVLGYSGRDPNIQELFIRSKFNRYPLFWINPSPPNNEMDKILTSKPYSYTYIECIGANQFITDFLRIINTLDTLSPEIKSGPTIIDLKNAFESSNTPLEPLYKEFLDVKYQELENSLPDFSQFAEYDDAIMSQIETSTSLSYELIESFSLAIKYGNNEVMKQIYEFFGDLLNLYFTDRPDGYIFLIEELFISFISLLIRFDCWEYLGELLESKLFVKNQEVENFFSFTRINKYVRALDDTRNRRLNLRRVSVQADTLNYRFTETDLKGLIKFQEFLEADYFLYMKSLFIEDDKYTRSSHKLWCPKSCIYLETVPTYLKKAMNRRSFQNIISSIGVNQNEFIDIFSNKYHTINKCFSNTFYDDPLSFFEFDKLGSIE